MGRRVMCKTTMVLTAILAVAAEAICGDCQSCCETLLMPHDATTATATSVSWSQGEAETNKIDILLAFDASATAWLKRAGWTDAEAFANEAICDMNCGLANTGLDKCFTFRLAGIVTLASDLSARSHESVAKRACGVVVSSGTEKTDFTRLRSVRDASKADIVAVLFESATTNAYGSGYQLLPEDFTGKAPARFAKYAYCACSISAVFSRYSLLHEVGHVMGAGHADTIKSSLKPGPGVFAYASGYNFVADGCHYCSVMGYPKDGINTDMEWERLPFFSSPDYTLLLHDRQSGEMYDSGVAVGTAYKNDNTRALREIYAVVANFRVATALDVIPATPEDSGPEEKPQPLSLSLAQCLDDDVVSLTNGQVLGACQYVRQDIAVSVSSSAGLKTKVKVKGLPSGLSYSAKTGHITGYAKKSGTFSVSVTASDTAKHSVTCRFSLTVAPSPTWASGTFDGVCLLDGNVIPATVKVALSGRITGKFTVAGKARSASVAGFSSSSANGILADLTVKLAGGQSRDVRLRIFERPFADRLGRNASIGQMALLGNDSGFLVQDVWSSKSLAACTVKKSCKLVVTSQSCPEASLGDVDELMLNVKAKGKVSISGKISGVRASASAKLCRLGWTDGGEHALLNVVMPSTKTGKKFFPGYSRTLELLLHTDAKGRVVSVEVASAREISAVFDL